MPGWKIHGNKGGEQCEHLRHLIFAGNEALLKSCGRLRMTANQYGTLDFLDQGNGGALVF